MNDKALWKRTGLVVDAALQVHAAIGPGLLESAYEACLVHELALRGAEVKRQVPLSLRYRGLKLDLAYRMDVVVDGTILVEVKAIERLLPLHSAQVLSYLRASGIRVGLLINFNVPLLRDGIKRMVN